PQDLVQRRRKGTPVRSPAQGDHSAKGIVFSFRIQSDADLSMAVDIHSYDQQSEEPADPNAPTTVKAYAPVPSASVAPAPAVHPTTETGSVPGNTVRVAGNNWSSDPSSFRSSHVMDLSRNLLILHSRKPTESLSQEPSLANHPYKSFSPRRQSSSSSSSSVLVALEVRTRVAHVLTAIDAANDGLWLLHGLVLASRIAQFAHITIPLPLRG
ncbi:hypothetical protein BGW38_005542, partial [Lunasporangiospora selenospora]